jgi:hypothetical protein
MAINAQKANQYHKLKALGYTEKEIYEDLGNANFLLEKYENAAFWYKKLSELEKGKSLTENYQKRFQFALKQVSGRVLVTNEKNWMVEIKEDYQLKRPSDKQKVNRTSVPKYERFDFQPKNTSQALEYLVEYERNKELQKASSVSKIKASKQNLEMSITVTGNGKTAYFSKSMLVPPVKGIFSKKELIHKIYGKMLERLRWCPNMLRLCIPLFLMMVKDCFSHQICRVLLVNMTFMWQRLAQMELSESLKT